MRFSFSKGLHDEDGDCYDDRLFVFMGDGPIVGFIDVDELEAFANQILGSIKEIRENYYGSN